MVLSTTGVIHSCYQPLPGGQTMLRGVIILQNPLLETFKQTLFHVPRMVLLDGVKQRSSKSKRAAEPRPFRADRK